MTELQRHRVKEVATTYGISFAISIATLSVMPLKRVNPIVAILIFGIVFGTCFWVGGQIGARVRHRSFLITLLLQAFLYLLVIVSAFFFSLWPYIAMEQGWGITDSRMLDTAGYMLRRPMTYVMIAGCFLVMLVISSVFQVGKKLGPGVLWNWISGRYHDPREETRIFMFLDVKDSTRLAEKLGNLRFSSLVRDFFADMSKPVIETRGEVSHYIGDEAVLTWRLDRGLRKANCVELFFKMRDAIEKRRAHYLREYGFAPEFKAGVHVGPVVACEVGDIKSEIVFHGDVLNTAARIQSHCNELGADLLVSEDLLQMLVLPSRLAATPHGKFLFKGKEQEVGVYSLREGSVAGQSVADPEAEKIPVL